jgi:hypothetical protein
MMDETSFVGPILGENGFWPVNSTVPSIAEAKGIVKIKICMTRGFSVSYLDYFDCGGAPTPSGPTAPTPSSPSAPTPSGPTAPTPSAPTPSTPTVPTPSAPSRPTAPTGCPAVYRECDFSTLAVGVPLNDAAQAKRLRKDCLMTVTATNTINNNVLNIFNSSNIRGDHQKYDPDLGSPNRACPGGGPGKGKGGKLSSPFPNCIAQGNIMIIQNENLDPSIPNDSPFGGCMIFDFIVPVQLRNFGIMDIDEAENVDITITTSQNVQLATFESPRTIGNNGHWYANSTLDMSRFNDVDKMKVCFPGSGALTFIHFDFCKK